MDIKFHYICETVLPAVLRIYRKLAFIKVLSHTSVSCSKPVQALLSLLAQSFPAAFFVAVFHAWLEALALAVHCSPGALFHAWFAHHVYCSLVL